MALCDLNRLDEAIMAFRSAIALNPTLAEAHYYLGNALSDTDCHEEAIASYRDAIAAAPHFPEAHYSLANALRDAGNLKEATQHYGAALAAGPTFATGWRTATSMDAFPVDMNTLKQLKILKQDATLSDSDHCELGFALYQTCKRLNRLEEGSTFSERPTPRAGLSWATNRRTTQLRSRPCPPNAPVGSMHPRQQWNPAHTSLSLSWECHGAAQR